MNMFARLLAKLRGRRRRAPAPAWTQSRDSRDGTVLAVVVRDLTGAERRDALRRDDPPEPRA
jgi:hypothetical protein